MIRIDSEGQDISNGLLWISNCYQLLQSACYCNMDESEIIETVLSLVTSICGTVISKARAFQFRTVLGELRAWDGVDMCGWQWKNPMGGFAAIEAVQASKHHMSSVFYPCLSMTRNT